MHRSTAKGGSPKAQMRGGELRVDRTVIGFGAPEIATQILSPLPVTVQTTVEPPASARRRPSAATRQRWQADAGSTNTASLRATRR